MMDFLEFPAASWTGRKEMLDVFEAIDVHLSNYIK